MTAKQTYDEATIRARLTNELPKWSFEKGVLTRTYRTPGWPHTLMLVNTIGYLAEAAWHHPDLEVSYPQVVVKLSSHDAKGITDRDFALARRIEDAAIWRPEAGSPFEGFEKGTKKKWVE